MSSKKLQISEVLASENAQATKIIKECYEKKFSKNATAMGNWLGLEKQASQNVKRWLTGTTVPAGVIFKIFHRFPDLQAFAFSGEEAKKEDKDIVQLRDRIDKLLQSRFMLDHLKTQIGICENAMRQAKIDRDIADILNMISRSNKTDAEWNYTVREVQRRFGRYLETPTVHDPQTDYRGTASQEKTEVKKGAPDDTSAGEVENSDEAPNKK